MSDSGTVEVLSRADDVIRSAFQGLEMLKNANGAVKNLGLRNVIVFGRSVTFVLQNLRAYEDSFDQWYAPHLETMKHDPIFLFFKDARNNLEKQGRLETGTTAHVSSLTSENMRVLEANKPPGATGFFIGDSLGGSGWIVELLNGDELSFYVELPKEVGTVSQHFVGNTVSKYPELKGKTTVELAEHFINGLDAIVESAFVKFGDGKQIRPNRPKGYPRYLRVVK